MILNVSSVYKSYGKEVVLKNIHFNITEPGIYALVGPNGSGKSTLLNIITNLVKLDSGTVTINGKDNRNPDIFKEMSFMQDNTVLYNYLTGYDHLQFIAELQSISEERLIQTAKLVGNLDYLHKKVMHYSLGMKQHLLLSMAIINNPKLLILDEPLNGLDPTSAIKVRELLLRLEAEGTTILLSSHNLGEIDQVTSKILFLKEGKLIEEEARNFESVYYLLKVDKPNETIGSLIEIGMEATVMNDRVKIKCRDEFPFNIILNSLIDKNIQIYDIEKRLTGTEDRYKEIFSSKDEKHESNL